LISINFKPPSRPAAEHLKDPRDLAARDAFGPPFAGALEERSRRVRALASGRQIVARAGASNTPQTYVLDGGQYVLAAAGDALFAFALY